MKVPPLEPKLMNLVANELTISIHHQDEEILDFHQIIHQGLFKIETALIVERVFTNLKDRLLQNISIIEIDELEWRSKNQPPSNS
ncbi:hypothetical protein ACJX0J_006985, partial [Zea mays]